MNVVKKVKKLITHLKHEEQRLRGQAHALEEESAKMLTQANRARRDAGENRNLAESLSGALGGAK